MKWRGVAIFGLLVLTGIWAFWWVPVPDPFAVATSPVNLSPDVADAEPAGIEPFAGVSRQPTETEPPSTPTGLHAVPVSTTQIDLQWQPATDDTGVSGYVVYRDRKWLAGPETAGFSDRDLEPGSLHFYSVVAYDSSGNRSAEAGPISVRTLANGTAEMAIADIRADCAGEAGCFTLLGDWQAGFGGIDFAGLGCKAGDLVCANLIAVARISGDWPQEEAGPLIIKGWNSDSDRFIHIYTEPDARHKGLWDTEKHRLTGQNRNTVTVVSPFVRLEGLQISLKVDIGAEPAAAVSFQQDHTTVAHNLIRADLSQGSDGNSGIHAHNAGFRRMLFQDNIIDGFRSDVASGINRGVFLRVSTATLRNNRVQNCDVAYEVESGAVSATGNTASQCRMGLVGTFTESSGGNRLSSLDEGTN